MPVERKLMQLHDSEENKYGYINLSKNADPSRMKITFLGKTLYPISYNSLGHPIFSYEQYLLYKFESDECVKNKKETGIRGARKPTIRIEYIQDYSPCTTYYHVKYGDFLDSHLENLSLFNELVDTMKKLFFDKDTSNKMTEYVFFGKYLISKNGELKSISRDYFDSTKDVQDIVTLKYFSEKFPEYEFTGNYVIPKPNIKCPYCGKTFSIEDVKEDPCIMANSRCWHESCYSEFKNVELAYKLTTECMDEVITDKNYTYEIVPSNNVKNSSAILFHTSYGDVIVDDAKIHGYIVIEWQENFKDFDFDSLCSRITVDLRDKDRRIITVRNIYLATLALILSMS